MREENSRTANSGGHEGALHLESTVSLVWKRIKFNSGELAFWSGNHVQYETYGYKNHIVHGGSWFQSPSTVHFKIRWLAGVFSGQPLEYPTYSLNSAWKLLPLLCTGVLLPLFFSSFFYRYISLFASSSPLFVFPSLLQSSSVFFSLDQSSSQLLHLLSSLSYSFLLLFFSLLLFFRSWFSFVTLVTPAAIRVVGLFAAFCSFLHAQGQCRLHQPDCKPTSSYTS